MRTDQANRRCGIVISVLTIAILTLLGPAMTEPVETSAQVASDSVGLDSIVLDIVDSVIVIPSLDFASVPLADALTAIGRAYKLPLYVDSSVSGPVSLRLDNVSLNDALVFIIRQYGLSWQKTGEIIEIYKPYVPAPEPEPLDITFANDLLSFDLERSQLSQFVDQLVDLTGRNIIIEGSTRGSLSGRLSNLEFEKAIRALLSSNGFTVRKMDDVFYISVDSTGSRAGSPARSLDVRCESGLIAVNVSNSPLSDVIAIVTEECSVNIFVQTQLAGNITASFSDKTLEESLTYLLLGSQYSFKEVNGIYFIGPRESQGLYDSRLIKLNHLIAGSLVELIPASLNEQLTVQVVKEHNGLIVTGPRTDIAVLESFIAKVDIPTAQVLFEVIVVDYTTTDRAEFGITANNFGADSGLPGQTFYPMIDISDKGSSLNDKIASLERHLGVSNLGTLSADFFIRLEALVQEGKANIRSHPKIAALNSHPATIAIGTTQYYLLESKTTYISQASNEPIQTAQRFETVVAEMTLEVTPYVNQTKELTVELKSQFNTPAGTFDPDIPPTINRRVLTSTVNLKDGETIVLGGLVQENKTVTIDKLPLLGDLPIIGRLFQNRTTVEVKSELMIYVTPHVYIGSEAAVDADSLFIGQ
ncbi:MAG: hypothetical protein OEV68_03750 [candidate division Zixibacteria bacterium]|nr:hypothetical protein [candidate division Zixibacteria bacterium]MDH4032372.1 hypothetical protein [candidate division Zixibacteria bacterium]